MLLLPATLALGLAGLLGAPRDETPADAPGMAAQLIAAHNRERADRKLEPLAAEPRLTEAALAHARDMAEHKVMSHEGTDGSAPVDRVRRTKYPFQTTGENVARGQPTVESVMLAWMNSPHHKDNILGDFSQIGVAAVEGADGSPFWCVVFGRPYPQLDPAKAEATVVERLNAARAESGEGPGKVALKVEPRLARASRQIAADLAARPAPVPPPQPKEGEAPVPPTPPEAPKTPNPVTRIDAAGYRYASLAQSGATGNPTPEDLLKSLLASDGQKEFLLGDFTEVGVGYALAEDGHPCWSIVLAKPRR